MFLVSDSLGGGLKVVLLFLFVCVLIELLFKCLLCIRWVVLCLGSFCFWINSI